MGIDIDIKDICDYCNQQYTLNDYDSGIEESSFYERDEGGYMSTSQELIVICPLCKEDTYTTYNFSEALEDIKAIRDTDRT